MKTTKKRQRSHLLCFAEEFQTARIQTEFDRVEIKEFISGQRSTFNFLTGEKFLLRTELFAHDQTMLVTIVQIIHGSAEQSSLVDTYEQVTHLPNGGGWRQSS